MIGLNSLSVSPDLMAQICQIDEFKGYWNGIDDHTVGLNALSGVASYNAEFKELLEPLRDKPLSMALLMALHKVVAGAEHGGVLKAEPCGLDFTHNGLLVGSIETADPHDASLLLDKLMAWFNQSCADEAYHPVLLMAVFIAVFLQISPFAAGNMKLARFLIVLLLLKFDYRYALYAPIDGAFEEDGLQLYEALRDYQAGLEEEGRADWRGWLGAFLMLLAHQCAPLKASLKQDEGGSIADMPKLSIALLGVIQTHKRATMKQLIKETKGRRSTIKLRLQELIEQGLVVRHGAGRGVWYSL